MRKRRAGLENDNARADPAVMRGRPMADREASDGRTGFVRAGGVALACVEEDRRRNTGRPVWRSCTDQTGVLRGGRVADRLVVLWRPGHAGGGKGSGFERGQEGGKAWSLV